MSEARAADGPRPKAVLVGVLLPGVSAEEQASSLEELGRLGKTLGLEVVGRVTQRRESLSPAAVLGEGKLRELARWTGGRGEVGPVVPRRKRRIDEQEEEADGSVAASAGAEQEPDEEAGDEGVVGAHKATMVLVDHDLGPSQARNLERATGAEVLDRSSVILSIFHRHARSREARLQVEIARLVYLAPRLRESGAGKDRQRGGVKGKGSGESALELDRRKIRDRIAELRRELEQIEKERGTRRQRRAEQPTAALVGYTNAGKSSLMRALTGSDVYVADELFATLDTTVRALEPETRPRILVSDTVGFIKKLPHDLVASFRSTLAEARDADLLVHVVDASDPAFEAQMQVTREVLRELEAPAPAEAPEAQALLVLNKADRLTPERRAELALAFPDALLMSARSPEDVARLHAAIVGFFERAYVEREVLVPYSDARRVAQAHESCHVLAESYVEGGTLLRVRGPAAAIARLER